KELLRDAGDGNVEDVDVLLPDQVQKQVEGALKLVQMDNERIDRARARHTPISCWRGWSPGSRDGSNEEFRQPQRGSLQESQRRVQQPEPTQEEEGEDQQH